MKAVIQRVNRASVKIDGRINSEIKNGLLVFFGAEKNDENSPDAEERIKKFAEKLQRLRIFSDENGKTNLSVKDVNGELLIVSQFTLCADISHGNRPSFTNACAPERANELYELFVSECNKYIPNVRTGVFGADMKVELLNDGPFTINAEF